MLGTFSPQVAPYTHVMDEETTPSGVLARGAYTAKTKVSLPEQDALSSSAFILEPCVTLAMINVCLAEKSYIAVAVHR